MMGRTGVELAPVHSPNGFSGADTLTVLGCFAQRQSAGHLARSFKVVGLIEALARGLRRIASPGRASRSACATAASRCRMLPVDQFPEALRLGAESEHGTRVRPDRGGKRRES